jgi:hypothetical protein
MENNTINLINNNSLTSMGSAQVNLVVTLGWNSEPHGIIVADGVPMIWAYLDEQNADPPFTWVWVMPREIEGPTLTFHRVATVEFLTAIGEVSEDDLNDWASAVGTDDEGIVFEEVFGSMASEGHGLMALIDQVEAALRAADE